MRVLTGGLLLCIAAAVSAVEYPGPEKGDWSLAFELVEGQHFGLWKMVGKRLNLGVELKTKWADSNEEFMEQSPRREQQYQIDNKRVSFALQPSFKWYGGAPHSAAVFCKRGGEFGFRRHYTPAQ